MASIAVDLAETLDNLLAARRVLQETVNYPHLKEGACEVTHKGN